MLRFNDKQKEYWQKAHCRWNIKSGATRSGKTFVDFYNIPKRIRACTGQGLIVLLGNTKGTLERNILTPMRNIWTPSLVGNISSDNTVNLFGRRCYALGADKINQVSKIQGSEIEYCYGDEITTWNEEIFTMLKSRLSAPNSCFDGTCNPEGPAHWLKSFIDSAEEKGLDIFSQSYTIYDNPRLPRSFVENLEKEYAGTVAFDRFILGKWQAAQGVIYRKFADDPERFIIDKAPDDISYCTIGVDFGGSTSAHAFILVGVSKDFRKLYVLDEYYKKKEISPDELQSDFLDFVRSAQSKYNVPTVRCDSAETVLINGLRNAAARESLPISVKEAKKGAIIERIRFFQSLMAFDGFRVMRHCKHLISALSGALWDSKSQKDVRLDDGSINIDSLDAMEYASEDVMDTISAVVGLHILKKEGAA